MPLRHPELIVGMNIFCGAKSERGNCSIMMIVMQIDGLRRPVSRFAMEENIDSTMIFDEGGQMVTNPTFLQDHGAGSESDGESNNSSSSTSTQSGLFSYCIFTCCR